MSDEQAYPEAHSEPFIIPGNTRRLPPMNAHLDQSKIRDSALPPNTRPRRPEFFGVTRGGSISGTGNSRS